MVTVTQIEYILAIARESNFRRAAESCFVTQPTLSTQVQKLEEELGVLVFDRSKSPVKPTRIGQAIIDQAQLAYRELQRMREIVDREKGEIRGDLRVGVIPTISSYLLPLFLRSLHHKFPDLILNISELTTENCLAALDEEEIDVAILATPENSKLYVQEDLYNEEMFLFVNKDHPLEKRSRISVSDLNAEDLWLLEEGHCLRDEILSVCHLAKEYKKRPQNLNLKIGNLESLRFLVEENYGYTLLPFLAAQRLTGKEKKLLRPFVQPRPFRTVNLTKKRRHLKGAAIEALKWEILDNLPEGVQLLS